MGNHANRCHRTDATRSPATGGRARRVSNDFAAPSSLPSSSPLPHRHLPPSNAPAPTTGIFAVIHSRPGDLVDLLTRSGSFAFLGDLFDTERLFDLCDFGIPRVMPKGEAIEQFTASMHLVLDLADKCPRDSLAAHILDVIAQFLPALLMPCSRRDRVRQIVSNAKRFQRGEWKGLWETTVHFERKETDNTAQRSRTRPRCNHSIQDRVVYADHCARWGALSKANQTMTSDLLPNSDPLNMDTFARSIQNQLILIVIRCV